MKTYVLIAVAIVGSVAQAHECPELQEVVLRESVRPVGECRLVEQPRLAWTQQSYEHLRENPRRVQYWTGGYRKEFVLTQTIRRDEIDPCNGNRVNRIGRLLEERKTPKFRNFVIENPNLDPEITESFMLSPMVEYEAVQELEEARQRCLVAEVP